MSKTRQEEAYEYITSDFFKLLERDKRIDPELRGAVIAYWQDLFEHPGVKNNMLQSVSNFLGEVDKRMDASRKAGIVQMKDTLVLNLRSMYQDGPEVGGAIKDLENMAADLIAQEDTAEEIIDPEAEDLSEVGGADEDDTPIPL